MGFKETQISINNDVITSIDLLHKRIRELEASIKRMENIIYNKR
jgi:prefoldin subunit 5